MNLFSGYLPSRNKTPLTSVKSGKILSSPPDGDYVGVLKPDIIQLDFDDKYSADIVIQLVNRYKLKCDILKTTRGVHLYFVNDKFITSQVVGTYNAMGIKCDIGLGSKNRVVPLRATAVKQVDKIVNGEQVSVNTPITTQREWLQTYDKLETVPAYFRPITKTDQCFATVSGRNQTLFDYILRLQYYSFTRDEVRRTIKMINEFMLPEPLTDREIDTITRDEAFSEELFFEKSKFLHHRFGDYMLANSNILIIDEQPHIYTIAQLYANNPDEFEKQMIKKIPQLKEAQRKEVYKYIGLKCDKKGVFSEARYVGLKSYILDIQTMEHIEYSPKYIINNRIDYDYDEFAYNEDMDKVLNRVSKNDPQIRALIEEMIGYTLFRKNTMQVCFILTGEGSNGKSTILNVVKQLLGKHNYSSLDMRELEDDYKPSEMYNKLANIGDDISAKYMETSSVFKKAVTGESFMVQKKYGHPFALESYATQIFCANELPNVHDKSNGFNRRIQLIPFNANFTSSDVDYDPFIETKLLSDSAIAYLVKLAVDGLLRVLYTKSFTTSDEANSNMAEYVVRNNNVLEWLEDNPHIEHESVADVYLQYQLWCVGSGCNANKRLNFTRELTKHTNYKSVSRKIKGKSVRIYVTEQPIIESEE